MAGKSINKPVTDINDPLSSPDPVCIWEHRNMKEKLYVPLVFVTVITLFSFCNNSSDPGGSPLTIDHISVGEGDSLSAGAGIVIRFSTALDLTSLDAYTVYQQFQFSLPGQPPRTANLEVFKILAAQNITLNGAPLTIYYHPAEYSMALIEETTVQMPEGTGEGLVLNAGQNILTISANIQDRDGNTFESGFEITLYRSESAVNFKAVPNPVYSAPGGSAGIMFTNLPQECQIYIYDTRDNLIKEIAHSGAVSEMWDITNQNDVPIGSGIYSFRVENQDIIFTKGVCVYINSTN